MPTYRYHWTHRANLASIATSGLDPSYANKKRRVVWMCGGSRVLWAVSHVSKCHECSPDDMVLLRLRVDGLRLDGTSWPDVVTSAARIAPSRLAVRTDALSGRFVSLRRWRRA